MGSLLFTRAGARKRPTFVRLLAVGLVLLSASFAHAQPMTETELVEVAISRTDLAAYWDAVVQRRAAAGGVEPVWSGPELEFAREQFPAASTTELLLSQEIPLTNPTGVVNEAAKHEGGAESARMEQARLEVATAARERFWSALTLQRHIEAQEAWITSLNAVAETMKRRVEAGESAPYQLGRFERELVEAQATLEIYRAELASVQAGLAVELGLEPSRVEVFSGELLPSLPPQAAVPRVPELAALDHEVAAARLPVAGSRVALWIPALTISAGYINEAATSASNHGFIGGISIELPFANKTSTAIGRAETVEAQAQTSRAIVARTVDARVARLRVLASHTRGTAEKYAALAPQKAKKLAGIAELAFNAGEVGILEYLDSHRGVIEAGHRAIELAARARQANIALNAALGVE